MSDDDEASRRRFLKATATAGALGMTGLAGCGGQQSTPTEGGGEGTETATDSGSDGEDTETETSMSMGDPLPEYTYMNNPPNYNPARHDAINLIGERLNELGFNVNVQVFEWGTLYNRVTQEQDFSFTTWNRGLGIDPGRRMPEMFHSSNTDPGGGNFTGYTNEDLDPVLMEQLQVSDVSERTDLLFQIQETINTDVPMHPIVQMPNLVAFNNQQVSGWVDHLVGYYHFQPQTSIEVDNSENSLRGSWSETLGTLNVLGYNNETKLIHQFEMLYDKLVRINNNLEADPELSLATEWSRPDNQTVTYTIRDGHQWHDGETLDAGDVEFTLNYITENEVPLYSTQWEQIDSVERDGNQVTVNFNNPIGPVHTLFSNQIPIVPQHIWQNRDDPTNTTVTEPVGSGPLAFDYWDQGSELGLVRNDNHWNTVNYDSRIWRIIPETSTNWQLLLEGDLNYLPFSRIGRQLSQNSEEESITVQQTSGDGWWHFSQNLRLDGLGDPAVRRAAVNAIPKTAISDQILYGYPRAGWNLIGESFGQFSNPDVPMYEESLEAARSRLEEAGYGFGEDGTIHAPSN
jgi:peptide/nickel transport system substrate-binding protein